MQTLAYPPDAQDKGSWKSDTMSTIAFLPPSEGSAKEGAKGDPDTCRADLPTARGPTAVSAFLSRRLVPT
jgi:hypothetical protein